MAKIIMIVDDSPLMRSSLKANLELGGFKVEFAGDGVLALAQLKSGVKPDLIITDINMPNMGGMELIKNLRNLPGFRFRPPGGPPGARPFRGRAGDGTHAQARTVSSHAGTVNAHEVNRNGRS